MAVLGPGLLLGVLVGVGLSGVVGITRPWMVLETRADTVSRLRSGESGGLCRFVGVSEETSELVAVTGDLVPF